MGTEAQKLISLSLEKIANCRRRRREMSLHKNLLLTTVIHKARLAIMEETYYMMNYEPVDYAAVEPNQTYYDGVVHRPSSYGEPPHYLQPVAVAADEDDDALPLRHHHHADVYDVDDAMEWEGSDGSSPAPPSLVIMASSDHHISAATSCDDDDDDSGETDKENRCPGSSDDVEGEFLTSCCEQRFGACRSPDCQFLRSGHKRLRPGSTDEDVLLQSVAQCHSQPPSPSKRLKWDEIDARDMDPDSDTSHALRLVSVLSASLSVGNGGTTTPSSSCSSLQPPPTVRLIRSISTPDLCSKQAKDAMDIVDRPAVLAIAV